MCDDCDVAYGWTAPSQINYKLILWIKIYTSIRKGLIHMLRGRLQLLNLFLKWQAEVLNNRVKDVWKWLSSNACYWACNLFRSDLIVYIIESVGKKEKKTVHRSLCSSGIYNGTWTYHIIVQVAQPRTRSQRRLKESKAASFSISHWL